MKNNLDIKYYTKFAEGHRPELQSNGRIVMCTKDLGNGYLVVTTDEEIEPNTWLIHEKNMTKIESYE